MQALAPRSCRLESSHRTNYHGRFKKVLCMTHYYDLKINLE